MSTEEGLMAAVERFGQTLEGAGMARMPARVFAYVLAEDRDRYTARELADGLHVSAAAISGAVRYLIDARLLVRERALGGRGDIFRVVEGDIWATILGARLPMIQGMLDAIDDAIALLGEDSPGRRRLEETRDFFAFTLEDMTGVLDRWRAYRSAAQSR